MLGSILLVAITVAMVAALAALLFAFSGPERVAHARLALDLDPGRNGWGTGDESIRLLHRGGDPLEDLVLLVRLSGDTQTLRPDGTGPWSDGTLRIGESWRVPLTVADGAQLEAHVVLPGARSQLLASSRLVAGAVSTTDPCLGDTSAPSVVQWNQVPDPLAATHTGGLSITAQLADGCWGVSPLAAPEILWRLGTAGPFTNAGAMVNVGVDRWAGTVPAQAWTVGTTLQYQVGPLLDLGGNEGMSELRTVTIQADCSQDNVPPTVQSFSASPADLRSTTVGPLTVTLVATDNCAGIDQSVLPILRHGLDGSTPTSVPMALNTTQPCCTWTASVPDPGWASLAGRTLEISAGNLRDRNGNSAATGTLRDRIDPVYAYSYFATHTAVTGTVANAGNARSDADAGAEATLAEAASSQAPATQTFNANGVVLSNRWTSPGSAFASDNQVAAYSQNCGNNVLCPDPLKVAVADPVVQTGAITRLVVHAEVAIAGSASPNDQFVLQACIAGGSCTQSSPAAGSSSTDTNLDYDVTSLRPGGGSWTWSDIVNLEVYVQGYQQGGQDGTWRVDWVWVDVTSITSTHALNIRLDWSGVPAGAGAQVLELRYRATGDTFRVEVCQDLNATCTWWVSRGTLGASSSTTFVHTLTAAEFRGGAPRIRFVDSNPTGAVQGNLYLDWARVGVL